MPKAKVTVSKVSDKLTKVNENFSVNMYDNGFMLEVSGKDADGQAIQDDVTEQFGVPYTMVKELVLTNFINRDLLDLKFA